MFEQWYVWIQFESKTFKLLENKNSRQKWKRIKIFEKEEKL